MKGFKYWLGATLILATNFGIAQGPQKNLIKHWSIKDGLSQGVVNSILQDNQSFIWLATEDGLNRFDGHSFKVFRYDPDSKGSIADNYISSVFRDTDGTVWVSSRKGLLKFDRFLETFSLFKYDFPPDLKYGNNDVSYITEGNSGNLWICWYGIGFASFDKSSEKFTPYTTSNFPELTSGQTVGLYEDKFGLLWVATQDGGLNVFQVSKGIVTRKMEFSDKPIVLSSIVRCFAEDKAGNVWIGTSQGLVVYKRQENRFHYFDDFDVPGSTVSVFSLLVDSNDNLWIGTQGNGLHQLDLRQFNTRSIDDFVFLDIKYLDDFDISKRTVQSIYEDKDKNIWIGTFGDGVYLVGSDKVNFIKINKPIYKNGAVSFVPYYGMCHDQEGNLWLGTDGNGIFKSDAFGNTLKIYSSENKSGLKDNAILSALCDSKGRLWFGSYSRGVFLYNKSTDSFENYRYQSDTKHRSGGNDVRVIFEDSNKNIWVGTNRGGLCLIDHAGKVYRNPSFLDPTLAIGDIRSIAEDTSGNLWIGTYGDGLYLYDPSKKKFVRCFTTGTETLKSDIVFSVKSDHSGNIWVGTAGGGLYVYHQKTKRLKRLTEKDGLANNTIYTVFIDKNENVWVSTNAGISKYSSSQNRFYNYNVSDGLQEGQFNPGSGLYNELGGYMCLGGTVGLNMFFPDQVKVTSGKPKIMLTGLSLFNKPIHVNDSSDGEPILRKVLSETEVINLSHDQNVLTFEFVGLNYSYPEKNIYAYKLEGLDADWNFVANQKNATYRYLKPGNYEFKVKASTLENVWDDHVASVTVIIESPFWKTYYAYAFYLLAIVGLVFLIVSYRKKQLNLRLRLKIEKRQRKHERKLVQQKLAFFTEISHEFKTPLTLIIGPLEEILTKEAKGSSNEKKLRLVYRNAHKLLNLINKLLDYRKIENGHVSLKATETNLVNFAKEICMAFNEIAETKNIHFHFESDEDSLMAWIDKEKIEMVLNNIISNSFKYIGQGNQVVVHLLKQVSDRYPQGRAVIKIKDNGIGIPKRHIGDVFNWFYKGETFGSMSSGIGLSLAKKLVHLHKGEIFIDSTEGSGSTFSIKIPLGNDHFTSEELALGAEKENEVISDARPSGSETLIADHHEDVSARKGMKSLLLIEDDAEIRNFLKEYFANEYRILQASNGKEGLEIALESHPDLIISDIMMPEMNGLDFCKEIKNNIRTSHIAVILLTARNALTHHKEGIEMGADGYITKPFSPEILALTVDSMLQAREKLMRFCRNLFANTRESDSPAKGLNSLDKKFLKTIYDQFKANLDKPDFNINELCGVLNMSRSIVYKKVKTLTGLSPVEYIRSLRMQEAAKLLKTRQYKVFEVVYMVGFSDLKYFRQCFTKEFGHSPSDFIKLPE